jgi:hypothetical protein
MHIYAYKRTQTPVNARFKKHPQRTTCAKFSQATDLTVSKLMKTAEVGE